MGSCLACSFSLERNNSHRVPQAKLSVYNVKSHGVATRSLCLENLSYRAAVNCNHRRAHFSFKRYLSLQCMCSSCSRQTTVSVCGHLFPWSDPRRFTATWRTSSTTAGSWRRGNPTRCGSPPSRSCPCAPGSRSCTASATTGSMQMMSSTSSRCVGQLEKNMGLQELGQIRESS